MRQVSFDRLSRYAWREDLWEVRGNGALVREGIEKTSKEIGTLDRGAQVVVAEHQKTDAGLERLRLLKPFEGWVSAKCLRRMPHRVSESTLSGCSDRSEEYRLRWALDVGAWETKDDTQEWRFLLHLIAEEDERQAVMRYAKFQDRQRALISRLMVRRCCAVALGMQHDDVAIDRTKGKKPFLTAAARLKCDAEKCTVEECPNFNFNVSHEGRYVVLASEPRCVVGVDVAAPDQFRRQGTPAEGKEKDLERFLATMKGVLAESEFQRVQTSEDQAKAFRYFWSCKEAFTKARGDGVAFGLARAEFDIQHHPADSSFDAVVKVDGRKLKQWRFFGQELDHGHVVTVARGPPCDIVDAIGDFKRTFSDDNLDADFSTDDDGDPKPPFTTINVRDLVPPDRRHAYDTALKADTASSSR